jgi:hypothetical protein
MTNSFIRRGYGAALAFLVLAVLLSFGVVFGDVGFGWRVAGWALIFASIVLAMFYALDTHHRVKVLDGHRRHGLH